jgi:hypothetical protein
MINLDASSTTYPTDTATIARIIREKTAAPIDGPYTEHVDVWPELAEYLLAQNTKNRPLRDKEVAAIARVMRAGEWMETGESIKVSTKGRLLDGQHRLSAIVRSGVTIRLPITFGVDDEVFKYLDGGSYGGGRRSGSDALHALGYKFAHRLASLIRVLVLYENGRYGSFDSQGMPNETIVAAARRFGPPANNRGVRIIEATSKLREGIFPSEQVMNLVTYVNAYRAPQETIRFFKKVSDGLNISTKADPAWQLRSWIENNPSEGSNAYKTHLLALTTKACNAAIRGEEIRHLYYAETQRYPLPIGTARYPFVGDNPYDPR